MATIHPVTLDEAIALIRELRDGYHDSIAGCRGSYDRFSDALTKADELLSLVRAYGPSRSEQWHINNDESCRSDHSIINTPKAT